jgi:8-oxo-dGTP pyrophosphatase MutT (NUDIX family)
MQRTVSSVLVPVFRDGEGELRIVLVQRGSRGVHGGEIGLPGGKREPGDSSLLQTALREVHEEIGLTPGQIEVLAALEPRDTRTSGFRVYPFLARITPPRRWRLAAGEITDVVMPTARVLADRSVRQVRELWFAKWPESRRVECVPLGEGRLLWGLTLRVLDAVVPRLLAGEWSI